MAFTAYRTWVAGDVLTAAQLNEQVRDNGNALSTALLMPEHQATLANFGLGVPAQGLVVTAGRLYAVPIPVPNAGSGSYSNVNYIIDTGGTGNIRLGVYLDNGGVPGALIQETASTAVSVGADTEVSVALTANASVTGPSKVWAACVFSGTPTVWKLGGIGLLPGADISGVYKAHAYGALPNPFGTIGAYTAAPALAIKRV